jgi:hypothetical protein
VPGSSREVAMKKPVGLYGPTPIQYIVCYAVWLCLSVATIFLALQVWTNLIRQPLPFSGLDFRVVSTIYQASLLVMGFLVLILILVQEHALRTGLAKNRFWPRVAKFAIAEAVVLGLSYVANFLILRAILPG